MGRDHYAGFRNGNTSLRCNSINTRKSLPGVRKNKMREIDSASKRHANPSQENGPLFRKVLLVLGVCSIQLVFHGRAWEFLRNEIFDANPFFSNDQPDPANRTRARLRLNQFGTTLGGPVKRDKLFFFV